MDKKKIIVILGIIVLIILLIISFSIDEQDSSIISEDPDIILSNAQKESENIKENEKKNLREINVEKYLNYYMSDEEKTVLVARPTCHYCQIAEPILEQIAKEQKLTIYYVNTDNFTQEDLTKFKDSNEEFKDGFGTPMLLLIGNNEIKDKVDGLTDKYHYLKFFKDNRLINKGE